jgi:hypothetical protein
VAAGIGSKINVTAGKMCGTGKKISVTVGKIAGIGNIDLTNEQLDIWTIVQLDNWKDKRMC